MTIASQDDQCMLGLQTKGSSSLWNAAKPRESAQEAANSDACAQREDNERRMFGRRGRRDRNRQARRFLTSPVPARIVARGGTQTMTTPSEPSKSDVTQLLQAWRGGDSSAGERLLSAIYAELHQQAARAMRREGGEHTLQATALVHEAYLRLVDQSRVEWRN